MFGIDLGDLPVVEAPEFPAEAQPTPTPRTGLAERVQALEAQVAELQQAVAELRNRQA